MQMNPIVISEFYYIDFHHNFKENLFQIIFYAVIIIANHKFKTFKSFKYV